MRNFLTVLLLALLFFAGCEVSFKSRSDKMQEQKVMVSAFACHDEETRAKELALEALSAHTALPSLLQWSELKRVSGDKAFCYEAFLVHKAWLQYLQQLQAEKITIESRLHDQNNSVTYDEKEAFVASMQLERQAFNETVANAELIAPTALSPFDLNQSVLARSVNARPSVSIAVNNCNHNSNYNCQVGFISRVMDESEEVRYYWTFGDGGVSQRKNPLHTYPEVGEYNATLLVQDGDDTNNSISITVTVEASEKPFALFDTEKESYPAQKRVEFKNISYSHQSKIVSYQWNFGDGYRSSHREPKHVYTKAGTYAVVLTVCSAEKACAVASKKIRITENTMLIDAEKGVEIERYMAEKGAPVERIVKKNSLMAAYRYGNIWLLTKRGMIECAVQSRGLSLNLMGQPKKCYWHERNAKQYMVELKEEG